MSEPQATLLSRVLAAQRAAWEKGDRCLVETLLQQFADLSGDREAVLDLIYNEVYLRERQGESARCAEYLQRFPQLTDDIRLQFDVHQAIQPQAVPAAGVTLPIIPGLEVLAAIGDGSVGRVYRARDEASGALVAVKVLRAELRGKRAVSERFLAEARAAASLDHPHLVKVFQAGESAAGPFFVMEFIDGLSLEEMLCTGLPEIGRVVRWLTAVAEAVHHAHEKGIIHQNLKPANILIDADDHARVLDCGMGNFFWQAGIPHLSSAHQGIHLGSPCYKSPEQFDDAVKAGPASDVYSLGAILYKLLTGRPPIDEGNFVATVLKVRSEEEPPLVRSLRPEAPVLLELICQNCMWKHPADRYRSALELADALQRFARVTDPQAALALASQATGELIPILKEITIVGRSAECDVVLKKRDVSRVHCQILQSQDEVVVEDLCSGRGTHVNGVRVKRSRLRNGDQLRIARQVFQVVLRERTGTI